MFPIDIWLAYTAACLLLVIAPAPTISWPSGAA